MKYLALLLIFGFGLSGFGQTIKSLGYNTTNGHIIYSGTNTLTFPSVSINGIQINGSTVSAWGRSVDLDQGILDGEWEFNNAVGFGTPNNTAITRANLGLGWSALTNTNAATSLLGVNANGEIVYTNTNNVTFTNPIAFSTAANREATRTNLGLGADSYVRFGSLAVQSPVGNIDSIAFRMAGSPAWIDFTDEDVTRVPFRFTSEDLRAAARTNLGLGTTNSVQFGNVFITNANAGSATNYMLSIGAPDTGFTGVGGPAGAVNFRMGGTALWSAASTGLEFPAGAKVRNTLDFQYGGGALGVISFSGVDPDTGRAISRTNLGLGGGITTNRTFVSYDGTNYTTNTVTISNGIVTGWTQ